MSSILYGTLTRNRLATQPDAPLRYQRNAVSMAALRADRDIVLALEEDASAPVGKVSHWQDVLAALIPAEVLGLHAIALQTGTTVREQDGKATTVISNPGEMTFVFFGLAALAVVMYFAGARGANGYKGVGRALVPGLAFVGWTMLQPSSAFDALGWNPSNLVRTMIAAIGAVLLGILANVLATAADKEPPRQA